MLYGTLQHDPAHYRIVLVHIRKTAGTSLGRMLHRAYGEPVLEVRKEGELARHDRGVMRLHRRARAVAVSTARRGAISLAKARGRPAFRAHKAPYVAGHFVLGQEPPSPRMPLYVTLVRDPVDRLLSDFWFMKGKRDRSLGDVADPGLYDLPLAGFVDAILARPDLYRANLQCCSLAGRPDFAAAREIVDTRVFLAGTTPQIAEMAARLGQAIGRDLGAPPTAKKNARRPGAVELDAKRLAGLRALNAEDDRLVRHIHAAFAALPASPDPDAAA